METVLLVAILVLSAVVLFVGFLLLGTLRALGLLSWRLDQLELTTPSRLGRDGLKVGKKALDFTLPGAGGGERSLHDFAGRKVLLVFTQAGCGPCKDIVPELNRVHDKGDHQVVVVNNGDPEASRKWAAETGARFLVLAQEKFSVSKRYQVFATPFAFLLDEKGVITSKGIAGSRQHLGYVLTGAGNRAKPDHVESEPDGAEKGGIEEPHSSKEVTRV
ncbi:MAG TPA: peroxiredoxin family protein [Gemmataceae bacterium]|nr:peroxiredoxin family protein [Gemmataceae bacterium]